MAYVVAAVQVAQEALGAIRNPLDRTHKGHRRMQCDHGFALQICLESESTADIRANHMQHLRGDIDGVKYVSVQCMNALAALVQSDFSTCRIDIHNAASCFHRGGRQSVVHDVDRHNMIGIVEYGVGRLFVAVLEDAEQISRYIGVHCFNAFITCVRDRYHRVEFIHIEVDKLGCVSGCSERFSDNARDGFADVPHPIPRQRRLFNRASGVGQRTFA